MHGGLRKKARGDAFDMSDSEDEAEQLRRKKQMQFKQMTKALISDDRIGQIAQNPKKMAFFNTLADHLEEPDYEFLNEPEMDVGSQSQSQEKDAAGEGKESFESEISIPDSQTSITATSNPLKRKSPTSQEKENRPPPNLRRTAASDNSIARKPISFADVQTSVMELLDDGQVVVPDSQFSESEEDEEDSQSSIVREKRTIIDRLTLSRTASMSSESPAAGNLAFHAPSASTGPGFRVPSLLRRATSNFSAVSASSGPNTPAEGGFRRGGTGKSNIHAQAREAERRSVLEKKDKKREESLKKKVRKAKGRGGILEDLGGGFE
jgi:mediator of replication checkpoint protein 1